MRKQKAILSLVDEWKKEPLLVTGLYRLFTYLPWKEIPKEYHSWFPAEAKKDWNKDLKGFKESHIALDVQTQIVAILNALDKKNIIQTFSILPIMLADVYVYGKSVDKLQEELINTTNDFANAVTTAGRGLAEVAAIYSLVDMLKEVQLKLDLKLDFSIDEQLDKIIEKINVDAVMKDEPLIKPEVVEEKGKEENAG